MIGKNMSAFVEHGVVTIKKVKHVVDGYGPDGSVMSLRPADHGIDFTFGAPYKARSCNSLSKNGLAELIAILQEVHEAMKD
jgi:hypothetical protein